MYGCGLRFGEAVNLLWNGTDIDFEQNHIKVSNRTSNEDIPPFSVKDYETRVVPMPDWVSSSLLQLQEISDENCPFVFLTFDNWIRVQNKWKKMLNAQRANEWNNKELMTSALNLFKRLYVRAGIKTDKKLHIHCLRKAYGTNLANCSTPVHTLKELMGHSSITTTMEYYLYSPDENKKKVVDQLNRMMDMGKENGCKDGNFTK